LAAKLPYLKRLAAGAGSREAHASLAGIALALRALGAVLGRPVAPGELVFDRDAKPRLVAGALEADFSIAHSGTLVGCAALRGAEVGFDLEQGSDERLNNWVAREATVKAAGIGMRAVGEVILEGGGAWCRGRRWHARPLDAFPGATACVVTSVQLAAVHLQSLTLADLFA
jgi:phosphopantetheinyl transferase